ncbi:MAG TPA: hypothetical protein VMH81_14920 [Bryobacteraceae bacterium]|nr:hypothetical protein [Bryobacteraceae bacterium]
MNLTETIEGSAHFETAPDAIVVVSPPPCVQREFRGRSRVRGRSAGLEIYSAARTHSMTLIHERR